MMARPLALQYLCRAVGLCGACCMARARTRRRHHGMQKVHGADHRVMRPPATRTYTCGAKVLACPSGRHAAQHASLSDPLGRVQRQCARLSAPALSPARTSCTLSIPLIPTGRMLLGPRTSSRSVRSGTDAAQGLAHLRAPPQPRSSVMASASCTVTDALQARLLSRQQPAVLVGPAGTLDAIDALFLKSDQPEDVEAALNGECGRMGMWETVQAWLPSQHAVSVCHVAPHLDLTLRFASVSCCTRRNDVCRGSTGSGALGPGRNRRLRPIPGRGSAAGAGPGPGSCPAGWRRRRTLGLSGATCLPAIVGWFAQGPGAEGGACSARAHGNRMPVARPQGGQVRPPQQCIVLLLDNRQVVPAMSLCVVACDSAALASSQFSAYLGAPLDGYSL